MARGLLRLAWIAVVAAPVLGGCLRLGFEERRASEDSGPGDSDAYRDGDVDLPDGDAPDGDTPDGDADPHGDGGECAPGFLFYDGACRQLCADGSACPAGERCVTVVCLPAPDECGGDCEGGLCGCADETCATTRCSPVDCGCQYNGDGDASCDGVLLSGVDNPADTCGPTLACDGLGGCQRAAGQPCVRAEECGSGYCADGVCCTEPCDGDCDQCGPAGLCLGIADGCSGECAACQRGSGSFSCGPNHAVCEALCAHTTCASDGASFVCDFTHCGDCATSDALHFTGQCGDGLDVLLPTGCRYRYDYSSNNGHAADWGHSIYECHDGSWSRIETFGDGDSCLRCTPQALDDWTDDCGGSSDLHLAC